VVQCNSSTSNYSTVAFSLPPPSSSSPSGPHLVSPEAIGTHILTHLKAITAEYLGHSQVTKAVIAVPAKFTATQRAATGAAYKAAGLKVVRVIEEPTAAAVAYQLHKKSNVHHILVFDFGGGTLDVSILYVAKGAVSVRSIMLECLVLPCSVSVSATGCFD
jgi:molecular chaperone DnaK (HSP70)